MRNPDSTALLHNMGPPSGTRFAHKGQSLSTVLFVAPGPRLSQIGLIKPTPRGPLTAQAISQWCGITLPDAPLQLLLAEAPSRAPSFARLPSIAGAVTSTETVAPAGSIECNDIWFFLAIRSRVRGKVFCRNAEPYLEPHDLTAIRLHVPKEWKP